MTRIIYIGNQSTKKGITTTTIDSLSSNLLKDNYSVKAASKKTNKFLRLLEMIWLVLSNSSKTNYVLIDTYSTQNFYYALIISQMCRIFNLAYIPILHGGDLPRRLKNNPKLSSLIFSNSYMNVSPSMYLEKSFNEFGFKNVRYIPNSIELESYKVYSKNLDTIKLLWVRSFAKIYNPAMAIEVLKELKNKGYNAELCMVGPDKDDLHKDLKALAKQYEVNVTFTGKLSKSDWIELSQAYNIFLNTTNFDNMPVSVLEAMALGFPIISSDVGGLPYLIDDGVDGLLVSANDVEKMTQRIIEVKEDPDLFEKLVKNARKKAESLDWNVIKHQWIELLK